MDVLTEPHLLAGDNPQIRFHSGLAVLVESSQSARTVIGEVIESFPCKKRLKVTPMDEQHVLQPLGRFAKHGMIGDFVLKLHPDN